MNATNAYDYILVGLGAATINLLFSLEKLSLLGQVTILILEPNAKETNDRTWCFWTNQKDPAFELNQPVISHHWPRVLLNGSQAESMAPYQYVHLRSKEVYQRAKALIAEHKTITWLQEPVTELSENGHGAQAQTPAGEFQARYIFDSRPPQKPIAASEILWQSFVGWRIRTQKPVFETDLCTLMDFEVPQFKGTQFMYVLPTSPTEALVEFTRFGRAVLSEAESTPILEKYIQGKNWGDFEILENEVNKIPMTLALNPKQAHHAEQTKVIPMGGSAGAIKASTGFAYKKIAEHTWRVAKALKAEKPLPTPYHPWHFNLYDEMLLRLLSEKPQLGKPIFKRMFERTPIQEVFQFLDEESSFRTDLGIMWRMPWKPFLWSAAYTLMGHRSLQVASKPKHAY